MKNKLLLLFLLLLAAWSTRAQTVIQSQSFEAGEAVNYTSNSFNYNTIGGTTAQNGNQYFQRVTETTTTATIPSNFWPLIPVSGGALNGTYFWAAEATQGRSNMPIRDPGYVALNSVSVAGYTNLQVKVAFLDPRGATNTFLDKDILKVEVLLNGAEPWILLGQFISDNPNNGGNLRQDLNKNGVYDAADAAGGTLNATMTDYTFSVGSSASTMVTRVVSSSQNLSSEIGFDNIRVLGTVATSRAPVLANLETTSLPYNEGDPATQLTNTLTVADPDNTTAAGATVSLTTGFNNSEDRLIFVNQPGITGSFNTGTGVLTLSGTASLAAYQAALRSVQYQNIDAADASPATRTVVFSLTDPSGVASAPVNRTITVTTHLDAATGLPYTEDFEIDGEGTRYASNHFINGNNNFAFTRTNVNPFNPGTQGTTVGLTTFSNLSNSYYWYGEATRNSANPSTVKNGTFTTKPLNTAGYVNLQFQLRVGASATNATPNPSTWLTTDYFKLYYRVAGTNTWTVFGSFRGTSTTVGGVGALKQDADPTAAPGSAAPTGTTVTPALATFAFALPASLNGQTLEFQLVVANQDGTSDLAYDLLQLTGTPIAAPTVTTAAASSITSTSAVLGGSVTADGGATVTDRGVVYSVSSTNATPTIGGTGVVKDSNGSGTGTFSKTITGLSAGTSYTVRAYALNSVGVSYGSAATFTTAAALRITSSQLNIACNGSASGSASVIASGGVPPYTYAWSPSVSTTATASNLRAGSYTVTVTDAAGATVAHTFAITQPAALTATLSQTNVSTNGGSDGSATVSVSGGTSSYTYSWNTSPVQTTATATGLSAGTYTVTVTDANRCTLQQDVTITQPSVPSLTISTGTLASPTGIPGGTYATITVTGTGVAQFNGAVVVNTSMMVSGGLLTNCQSLTGAGSFTLAAGATLGICDAAGISSSGATGAVQVTGPRTFSSDALYIYNGTAPQVTGSGLPATVRTLTLTNAAGLALTSTLTATADVTLTSGGLALGTAMLTLAPTATLHETTTGYATGTVQTTRSLATANASESFGGLGLTLTPSGNTLPGSTLVRRVTGTALTGVGTSQSIRRYFDIQPTVKTGLNVALTLTARDEERNGIAAANLRLFKSDNAGASWQSLAATFVTAAASGNQPTTYTASLGGIANFSLWTLGDAANPLPVELVQFTATAQGNSAVRLAWVTASEVNSARFEVERSADGVTFQQIGQVAAAGTAATAHAYTLLDATLPLAASRLYYRLRQLDLDGTAHYSPVRPVARAGTAGLSIYPNPTAGVATLTGAAAGAPVHVLDALGQVVGTAVVDTTGTATLPAGLATGVYIVRTGSAALRLIVE